MWNIAKILILFLLIVGFSWKLDYSTILNYIGVANWRLLIIAGTINLIVNTFCRAKRFDIFLNTVSSVTQKISLSKIACVILGTRTLNFVLPARIGEIWRITQLQRVHGYSIGAITFSLLIETTVDAGALGLLFPIGFFYSDHIFGPAGYIISSIAIFILSISLIAYIKKKPTPSSQINAQVEKSLELPKVAKNSTWLERIGVYKQYILRLYSSVDLPSMWIKGLSWSMVAHLVDIGTIALSLNAVDLHIGLGSMFVILAAVNLAIALPITPANLGTLETGAVIALGTMGIAQEKALAFAVLYHAVHVVPVAITGLLTFYVRFPISNSVAVEPQRLNPSLK